MKPCPDQDDGGRENAAGLGRNNPREGSESRIKGAETDNKGPRSEEEEDSRRPEKSRGVRAYAKSERESTSAGRGGGGGQDLKGGRPPRGSRGEGAAEGPGAQDGEEEREEGAQRSVFSERRTAALGRSSLLHHYSTTFLMHK